MTKGSYFSILLMVFGTHHIAAQEVNSETKILQTKMEVLSSKTGMITKFIDSKLSNTKLSFSMAAEARIRQVIVSSKSVYLYQIEKQGKYGQSTASIEYADLLEILKAVSILKNEVLNDIKANPDYMESKFVTADGFTVGYFVQKGKSNWYMKLDKYSSDNTVFLDSGESIEAAFQEAKGRIEELQK